jgi:hypothetical protein
MISSLKLPFVQSTQSGEGSLGETEKEGMGMEPGNRTSRSAHLYPA